MRTEYDNKDDEDNNRKPQGLRGQGRKMTWMMMTRTENDKDDKDENKTTTRMTITENDNKDDNYED